jgi:hypothetical protein
MRSLIHSAGDYGESAFLSVIDLKVWDDVGMAEGEGVRAIRICYVMLLMLSNQGTALRRTSLLSYKQRTEKDAVVCSLIFSFSIF